MLSVTNHSKANYEKEPYYTYLKIYNKLPLKIRGINNINKFKRKVKEHVLELSPRLISDVG
jgi:hypothetical protein